MVTGRRGIDPELDALFAPAEGDLYARTFLRNINFNESPQKAAEELIKGGITFASSVDEAREAYRSFLHAEIAKKKILSLIFCTFFQDKR